MLKRLSLVRTFSLLPKRRADANSHLIRMIDYLAAAEREMGAADHDKFLRQGLALAQTAPKNLEIRVEYLGADDLIGRVRKNHKVFITAVTR